MNEQMPTREGHRLFSTAFLVSVLAVLVLINVIVNALATHFEWYFYTEPRYEHSIGEASHAVLDAFGEEERVRVIFCMDEETLESTPSYALVLNTFRQLAERHEFISVEFVNIYLHPGEVASYRTRTLATGETVSYTINEQCVIIDAGGEGSFRVELLETFFILDDTRTITAYNGEEMAIACLAWVLRDAHPVAGFSMGHGENQSDLLAFYTTLVAAGYDVTQIDLNEELPEGLGLVIVANPRWDLDRGAVGSGVEGELDRLAAFLDDGGTLFVSLDPYAKASLSGLRGFLAERGLTATQDVIRDTQNSITTDGFTLVTDYAVNAYATAVTDRIGAFDGARALVREASAITCGTAGSYTAYPLLTASSSAVCYRNGVLVDSAGGYPVLAVSQAEVEGGVATVVLSSCVYLLANDAMNSSSYTNRDIVLATLEKATGMAAPVGCGVLPIESTRLENLTIGTARLYTVIIAAVIPISVIAVCAIVTIRRKTDNLQENPMKHSLPLFGKCGRGAVFTAVSVLLLVAALLLGIGGNALKTVLNSYIDATPEGLYTLTDTFIEEVKDIKDDIRIIFCADPDTLLENATTRYVYIMAREIEKAMSNVTVECHNVEANPTAVQEFRTTSSSTIGPQHVIVSCDKRYRIITAPAFWSTDSTTNTYFAFNGEYKMATTMLSITAIERPVVYLTEGHGEQHYLAEGLSDTERERHRAFYQLLIDGGLEVKTLDLDAVPAVPEDCVLLVMNGPTEDYAPTEDEIFSVNATSTLEKIDRYLDNAGSLMLFKDPSVALPALEEMLGEWGIAYVNGDTVKDPAADTDLSQDDTRDRFSVVYPDKENDALGYSLFGEVAGLATAPATAISNSGHIATTWLEPTKFISNDTSAMTSAVLRAPTTCRTYDGTGAVTDKSGDYVLARMTARVSVVNDVQDYYSYVFCAATTSLTDSEFLDDPSLGNYDVMFSTVRFISRTDAYASDALGGLNMNTTTFGGKRLQSVALSDTEVPKYQNGKLVHTYPAMTTDVIVVWTVLIMLLPVAVAVTGIVLCVRRRYR